MGNDGILDRAGGSEPWCFVHAADLHLDTPFQGLHSTAPDVARRLADASLEAFDNVVSLAVARRARFVVLAGDVYDGPVRGLRAQIRFRHGLERLSEEGIPAFVAHGNHDPIEAGWSAVRSWPPLVRIFPAHEPLVEKVIRDGEQVATVQGISYPRRDVQENLALRFERPDGPGPHIGVLHCNVSSGGLGAAATAVAGGWSAHADYSPCSLGDLLGRGLDYWALGHVHTRSVLAGGRGDPFVVYPGNTQGRSPVPAERGAKGAMVVHADGRQILRVEFVACDSVRFADIEIDLATAADVLDIADLLRQEAGGALEAADGRSLMLRGRLVGRAALPDDLQRPGTVDGLLADLRDGFEAEPPFAWWDTIIDHSAAAYDIDQLRDRGDFVSDLLTLAEQLGGDDAHLEAFLEGCMEAAMPLRLRQLAQDLLTQEFDRQEQLRIATARAIDLLGLESHAPAGAR